MKATKRIYSGVGSTIQELFYGLLSERKALADAITAKGVKTNTSDTLTTMAENISRIEKISDSGTKSQTLYQGRTSINISFNKTFDKPPTVASMSVAGYVILESITNITNTGFTANFAFPNSGSTTLTFKWIAIIE